tara:strand:+ start:554 stop:1279 length:726 start_codon:yes stop_codon:yes gene_type:complete
MNNFFSNLGNKVGNAFTNLGQGGNLFNANPSTIASLSDEDKKRFKQEGLQKFANALGVAAAIQSGNPQRIALAQQNIMNFQERKKQQEDERIAEANQQNLITNALTIAKEAGATDEQLAIIGRDPAIARSVVQSSLKPKETPSKNSFVVDILTKIQADPTYGSADNPFTEGDQRILDTISNTDPLDIIARQIKQNTNVPNINVLNSTEQKKPITVINQDEYDKLPDGAKFIYQGVEYTKGE